MDGFTKLSREAQGILVLGVLLLILSFLDWQQVSAFGYTAGLNEWHGIGLLAGLLLIVMLVWEVLRVVMPDVSIGTLSNGLVSVGLVGLMALFTVIAFLDKSTARHWPAWIALLFTIIVVVLAVMRARAEGVEMPKASPAGSVAAAAPAAPAAPAEPAESAEPAEPADSTDDATE
jgi:uncharacterized membrane protein YhdT